VVDVYNIIIYIIVIVIVIGLLTVRALAWAVFVMQISEDKRG
jgi:nitrogen fixation-related uncharacterized protein